MNKNITVILVSAIDWDDTLRRQQNIFSRLGRVHKVLWIEPLISSVKGIKWFKRVFRFICFIFCRKQNNDIQVVPLFMLLPFGRNSVIRSINKIFLSLCLRLCLKMDQQDIRVLWLHDFWDADMFMGQCKETAVFYELYDDYLAYQNYGGIAAEAERKEQELMRKVDGIVATSETLRRKGALFNPQTILIPNGVDLSLYQRTLEQYSLPQELKDIPHPIIGYMGGNNFETCKKIDYDLLLHAVKARLNWSFVFLGPVDQLEIKNEKLDELRKFSNVYFLGKIEPVRLPHFLKSFDVGVFPWLINDFTNKVYALKLNEYFVCGDPVVSVATEEMVLLDQRIPGLIRIARNYDDFIYQIEEALNSKEDKCAMEKRERFSEEHDWDVLVDKMDQFMMMQLEGR
ncbi:MAG: glycosyltransferase [Candidatus Omnitrophica bacterium]|nr:glycosyltransferase [Candidatus Omnitrophota bacterium]